MKQEQNITQYRECSMSENSSQFQVLEQGSSIKSQAKSSESSDRDLYPSLSNNQIDINLSMKSSEEETHFFNDDDDNIMESIKLPPNAKIQNFGNWNKKQQKQPQKEMQKQKQQQQIRIEKERAEEREKEKEKEKVKEKEKEKERERERQKEQQEQKQTRISSSQQQAQQQRQSQEQPLPQQSQSYPASSDSQNTQQFLETVNASKQKSKVIISQQSSINETKLKVPQQQFAPKQQNKKTQEDQSVVDISRSMYGQRLNQNESKSREEQKNKVENSPLKPQKNLLDLNQINEFQSIHMQQIKGSIIKDKGSSKDVYFDTIVDNADHQNNMLFWKHDKDKISLRITSETYMEVVEHFLREQIMLPLISAEQFKSQFINPFMRKYTKFLNDFYQEKFKEVLKKVKQSHQQSTSRGFPSTASTPKVSHTTAGFIKSFLPFLKPQNSSKPQMANQYLRNKISIINMIIQQKKQNLQNTDAEQHTLKGIEQQICLLQMLISFQNSQNYCKKNYNEGGLDSKVWKTRGKSLNDKFKDYLKSLQKDNKVSIQI